ncbi:MAG: CRISPR-associated endonuclease Cas2 [Cyanobacteria bacterium]|nr:CRISPR-associated endonuclease Cas2 [Cyanobacteriota bacterium]
MLIYVVAYDIPCNKRRKKVADLLEGYGQRVQYSVFECALSVAKYKELQKRLRSRVKLEEDKIRIYPISQQMLQGVEVWGGVEIVEPPGSTIV